MNTIVTLKNTGDREINDVRHNNKYLVEGYEYQIYIRPKCTFWRLGLRFSFDRKGSSWSHNNRYNDQQIRHIEVCVGTRPNNEWQNSDLIQLQQYHIPKASNTLYSSKSYEEYSEVILTVRPQKDHPGRIEVSLSFGSEIHICRDLDIGLLEAFDIFAWADFIDFELECEIRPKFTPLKIELNSIKALSNQKSSIMVHDLAVFFGKNNSGKTSVLVGACNAFMNKKNHFVMDYLGLNRIHTDSTYNFELEQLDSYQRGDRQKENRKRRSENSIGQNHLFDWFEELALQDAKTREKILDWMNDHFENWNFEEIKKGKFTTGLQLKVNNGNPLDQGTGAKAVLPIIIQLFNPHLTLLAIDEPELGLEPHMQKMLFRAIKEASTGTNGFPLKRVLLATHSHLFLDRTEFDNNFSIQKTEGIVEIGQLKHSEELQKATYRLLGSNPSDLFFPSNVIIVEGKSDQIFLNSIYQLGKRNGMFSSQSLVFHYLEGFDKLELGSEAIVQMLKTQSYSPVYRDRICGLFDRPHRKGKLIEEIRKHFEDDEKQRFVLLDKPAIEYYYPVNAINKTFNADLKKYDYEKVLAQYLSEMPKHAPFVAEFLGTPISKVNLAERVSRTMEVEDLKEIDLIILTLLKKSDKLAYQ
jgi:predicted ATPase